MPAADASSVARGYLFGGQFAVAAGFAWLASPAGLYRLDPRTNAATLIRLPLRPFTQYGDVAMAAGDDALWIRIGDRKVVRFEPRSLKIVSEYAASGGGDVGYTPGALWVANAYADTTRRIRSQ